jgi:hypothetical protein
MSNDLRLDQLARNLAPYLAAWLAGQPGTPQSGTMVVPESSGTPATPASGYGVLFNNSTGIPSGVNDAGTVYQMLQYTEGTFTPTLIGSGGGGSFTYTFQKGNYIRVGNRIDIWIDVQINTFTSAPSGNLQIGGLPFTQSASGSETAFAIGFTTSGLSTVTRCAVIASGVVVSCYTSTGGLAAASLLSASAQLLVSGTIRV